MGSVSTQAPAAARRAVQEVLARIREEDIDGCLEAAADNVGEVVQLAEAAGLERLASIIKDLEEIEKPSWPHHNRETSITHARLCRKVADELHRIVAACLACGNEAMESIDHVIAERAERRDRQE